MKTSRSTAAWMMALGLAGTALLLPERVLAEPSLRDTMRFKLHYAQGVLEGITMENFPLVATNAQKLALLARSTEWKARSSAEYERFTADFLRQADALGKAAAKKNADAASVAYFQLTVSCVNCHRHLRGVETVRLEPVPRGGPVASARPSAQSSTQP